MIPLVDVKTLHAKIGQLTLENDFLEDALGKAGLLSAKKRLTGSIHSLSHAKRRSLACSEAVSTTNRYQSVNMTSR